MILTEWIMVNIIVKKSSETDITIKKVMFIVNDLIDMKLLKPHQFLRK